MKQFILGLLLFMGGQSLCAQEEEPLPRFYLGAAFGTSYSIGDFRDTDIANPDAGFAKNGYRIDLYGGFPLAEKLVFTGGFRYQNFETEIVALVDTYNCENPGADFSGTADDWQTFYFLAGLAYQVNVTKKFALFPRFGLGPMVARNPGITVSTPIGTMTNSFDRTSEAGIGLGYELGVGLQTHLGKHLSLLPTFTFSGGTVTISDVTTTTDKVTVISDYQPRIQSFNLGLSIGYRFY